MEVYHGSYIKIETPRIIKGRYSKDFGVGFYCTQLKQQAERWAGKYDTQIVNIYDYSLQEDLSYAIPSHWDIGKVYQRLILDVAHATGSDVIETLMVVYNSWITRKIDNYNSSMYHENPSYLFESYKEGTVLA